LPWQGRIERGDVIQHMFFVKKKDISGLSDLLDMKQDRAFVVLDSSNGFCDIAQYVAQYDNLKFVTVPSSKLNLEYEYVPKYPNRDRR